jgi:hypothetical protein
MNMHQKGSAKIVLIVVALAVVAVSGYLVSMRKPSPAPDTAGDSALARQALITYFDLLKTNQYDAAVAYHGSEYETLQNWNPYVNPSDHAALLKSGCEGNGLQCLKIKNVLSEQTISPTEFTFIVQFEKPEWSTGNETVFSQGPCCGAEDTGERKTDFEYRVEKVGDRFVVMTYPVYLP